MSRRSRLLVDCYIDKVFHANQTYIYLEFHIRNKAEVGTVKHVKPSSNVLTDHSKAVLLRGLWILFVICVLDVCLLYSLVCSLQPCGHLLGKGWPLGSIVCDAFLCVPLSHSVFLVRYGF